jgi:sec-independent protein translocase protein TatA
MGIGIKELLVILVIVIVLFGTKKLRGLGTDLGETIKGFRNSLKDGMKDAEKDNDDKKIVEKDKETPEKAAQAETDKSKDSV